MKKCIKCQQEKPLADFYTHPQMLDGHLGKCKECCKEQARARDTREYDVKRYRYNIDRLFKAKYYMLKRRSEINSGRSSFGKPFLSLKEWLEWCYEEKNLVRFMKIYSKWAENNFVKKLAPSIDRVDNKLGYEIGNLQWLTQVANSKKH